VVPHQAPRNIGISQGIGALGYDFLAKRLLVLVLEIVLNKIVQQSLLDLF